MTLLDACLSLASSPKAPSWIPTTVDGLRKRQPGLVDVELVARAVRPYLWLMERCTGDGLQLTQAGRLRPVEVKALVDELDWSKVRAIGAPSSPGERPTPIGRHSRGASPLWNARRARP